MSRRQMISTSGLALLSLLGLLFLVLGDAGAAANAEAFDPERFEALQASEALVLVDVAASWCPTCAQQDALVARYQESRPEVALHVLRVDFDEQKEWVRHFKAPRQSTLILYRGSERIWFSVAETREEVLFEVLDEAAAGSGSATSSR